MKTLSFLLFLTSSSAFAQFEQDKLYLSPSLYYTKGNYSTNVNSNSIALYNTVQLVKEFYLINHYDHLFIDHNDYKYTQQTFLVGGFVDLFPYYIKLNYSHYKGDYGYKPFEFKYSDYTNLYNIDLVYYVDWFYLGAAYTHINQIGFAEAISNQVTLRLERILSNEFFVSIRPTYTHLNDEKNISSVSAKLHYALVTNLLFKVGGFIGEREFYFDTDLLTFFNQNSIQKYQVFGQVEYSPIEQFKFILGYQQTKFSDFKVNYLVIGIKGAFLIEK